MLRASLSTADKSYLAAATADEQRAAILMALRGVLEFNRSLIPPIESLALTRHFEKFAELFIGQPDAMLRKSKGHGLTTSGDDQVRNALIAVAFAILIEGGRRKGNMGREDAGRFVAAELNRLRISDRGARFTKERVINVYLEVTRTPRPVKAGRRATSVAEATIATVRDRARGLAQRIYKDQMIVVAGWRGAAARVGELPAPFATIGGRKGLAARFIQLIETVAEGPRAGARRDR